MNAKLGFGEYGTGKVAIEPLLQACRSYRGAG